MAEPLRIALLTHSVNPRGGVVHTLELAAALHTAGHAVTIMATATPRQRLFRATPCPVEIISVPAQARDATALVGARIDAYTSHLAARDLARHFDIVHTQDGIGANALATLRQRGLIPGFIRTVHHIDDFTDTRLAQWQERSIREASALFCVSRLWQRELREHHGLGASLVPNGVDLERFSPGPQPGDADVMARHGLRSGAPLILAVGGVEERKNTLRLFEAFQRLRREQPAAQLVIAGGASLLDHSGYRRRFDDLLGASGIGCGPGQAVVLTGPLPDAQIPALLRSADVVAFASLREGFGLVVLEALACGTPVVVSRIAPFTEYLDGTEVHWADPQDAGSIHQALHAATRQPRFTPPTLCQRFSWQASAERHLALYRRFLETPHARHVLPPALA